MLELVNAIVFHPSVPLILLGYWCAAVAGVLLRNMSAVFRQMCQYGGRQISITPPSIFAMRKKTTFLFFYTTGILTTICILLFLLLQPGVVSVYELLPWPFATLFFHLCRRWVETFMWVKTRPDDVVSIPAVCAGMSFYMAAPITLLCSLPFSLFFSADGIQETPDFVVETPLLSKIFFGFSMMCQAWQSFHHFLLKEEQRQWKDDCRKTSRKYSFPRIGYGFDFVQEPHYTLEVLLHLSIALGCMMAWPEDNSSHVSQLYLAVPVFSIVNLTVTAKERRHYYLKSGEKDLPKYVIWPPLL